MSLYQWITCDRCGDDVLGLDIFTPGGRPVSAGFFRMFNADDSPSIWNQFQQFTEEVVCEQCMWADPRYIEVYPHMADDRIQRMVTQARVLAASRKS